MNFKKLLSVLVCLLFCASVVFSEDTYFVTDKQLKELTNQITNLQNNNDNLILLLEKQKKEYELQTKDYETLEQNYINKFLTMEQQQKNYQELLSRYESRNSIYKYGIVGALVVGLLVGVVISK